MKKILIFGGTQFVGKALVNNLLIQGHEVTIASRGNFPLPFASHIRHLKLDRYDSRTYPKEIFRDWDVVIDMLGFYPEQMDLLLSAMGNFIQHLVVVSSSAVYSEAGSKKEEDFDPLTFKVTLNKDFDSSVRPDTEIYSQGKRGVEAIVSQRCQKFTLVRFPKMIGADDLSHRFLNLLLLIKRKHAIPVLDLDKQASFLHSRDAARFLTWVIEKEITGAINAAADAESVKGLLEKIGADPSLIHVSPTQELELFKGKAIILDTTKARSLGYIFESNQDWLPEVSSLWNYHLNRISD